MMYLRWISICAIICLLAIGKAYPRPPHTPMVRIIPFQLVNKLIIIQAYIDGKKGNFILDTGAKKMILNQRYFRGISNMALQASNFAGSGTCLEEAVVQFGWDKTGTQPYEVIIAPLDALEKLLNKEIEGYIGYEMLKDFEVLFDYTQKEIRLLKLDRKGHRVSDSLPQPVPQDTILLHANGFMPYLTISIGDQELKLGIDSGATVNLLRGKISNKISPHFQPNGVQQTVGFQGKETVQKRGDLHHIRLGKRSLASMRCVLADMKSLNINLRTRIDGLLGYEFLKQYIISINFKTCELYIWKNTSIA